MRPLHIIALAALLGLISSPALAQVHTHGSRPVARTIHAPVDQPDLRALVSSDLGLHMSFDGGESFYWLCEDIIGYDVQTFAVVGPPTAEARQRAWLAGGQGVTLTDDPEYVDGLYRSVDGGCNWTPVGGTLSGQWASAIRVHPDRPDEVLVGTQHVELGNGVALSTDAGLTFEWTELRDQARLVNGLLRAPSDPERLYASVEDRVWRSDDGGRTWPTSFGDDLLTAASETLSVAAVHPEQPDTLWFFVDKTEGRALYVTTDGGQSRDLVHQAASREKASMAVVPDGDAGFVLVVGTVLNYYFISDDLGQSWDETEGFVPVECLVNDPTDPTRLFVCSNIFVQFIPPQIALGVSSDNLASIEPWFTYGQTADYLPCDADSQVNTICIPLDNPNSGGDTGIEFPDVGPDVGDDDAADAGQPDDVGGGAPPGGGDCDCALASTRSPAQHVPVGLIAALVGLSLWLRRSRSSRA